jgi:hypothetical protein
MKLIKILLLLFPIYGYGQTHTAEDWKTINKSNFSLKYPSDWELNQSGQMGTTLILFSKLESPRDQFKENVNLIIQDFTGYTVDLKEYAKLSEDQIKTNISNSKILESKTVSTNSKSFHRILYTGDQGNYHLKFEQYYFVIDNKAYILTFTCEQKKFKKFREVGESILNSFIINK